MKKLVVGVVLCMSMVSTVGFGQCVEHKNNANEPLLRSTIDDVYAFFYEHEVITQPLDRKDISVHSDEKTGTGYCPDHGKIVLSSYHIVSRDRLMVAVHPVISHQYAHLQHKRFTLFSGHHQSRQQAEYNADFITGYLNGRSTWLSEKQKAKVFCATQATEQVKMMKDVFERNNAGMRLTFQCLVKSMSEYQQMNALAHTKKAFHGLGTERKKAYLNGFVAALNYEILSWEADEAEEAKLVKWVEFFYEPLPDAKKRFAQNLFAFLSQELDVIVDESLLEQAIAPNDLMEKSKEYISRLMTVPGVNGAKEME